MDASELDPARFALAVASAVDGLRWEKRFRSYRALALKAGMTHTYLNARMSGSTPFNVIDIAALANAFEVTPDDIFERALELMSVLDDELPGVADSGDIEEPGDHTP